VQVVTPTPTPARPPTGPTQTPTGTSAATQEVGFFDGTFRDADWELATFGRGTGGTASGAQISTDGNPGEFRQNTHVLNAAPSNNASNVFSFHRRVGATYDPGAQGPISSYEQSEDARILSGPDQDSRPALRQDGRVYICRCAGVISSSFAGWLHLNFRRLTSADFFDLNDASRQPDFSANGSAIDFGYVREGRTSHTGTTSETRVAGIDNWRVIVNPTATASADHATTDVPASAAPGWTESPTMTPKGAGTGRQ
jgi:hypothetical protein